MLVCRPCACYPQAEWASLKQVSTPACARAPQDYHIHTHANYGVCQESDRFKMSPVNDNNASVESFKKLDLDYLQVSSTSASYNPHVVTS